MDFSSEETTRLTTIIGTRSTEPDHRSSQTRTNLENVEATLTVPVRLQRGDKSHPSRISAINTDQIRLTLQCLIGLEIETRATIYPRTRNSQLPTTVTNQT